MALSVGLILAKGDSKRLRNKNLLDYKGQPMFVVNLKKCLSIFPRVYVSSDSDEILKIAEKNGAIPIKRPRNLCGDTPNIPVYKHAIKQMEGADNIVAVQANSPNILFKTILTVKELMEFGYHEVMTCHGVEDNEDYHERGVKIYGSVWGVSAKRLDNYPDPYKPMPEILIVDKSVDIHDLQDYNESIWQSTPA
jgi:CMP-N-acetylneuraminic acid synthetase